MNDLEKQEPNEFPCFVWRMGLRGPFQSIWFQKLTIDQKPVKVLSWNKLTAQEVEEMNLDQLAIKYPVVMLKGESNENV